MSQLAQISALVGAILPLVVAIVQHHKLPVWARTVIGIVASIAASLITPAVQSQLNWHTWATSLIFVAGAVYTTYAHVWVPIGAVPWIEQKTSGAAAPYRRDGRH